MLTMPAAGDDGGAQTATRAMRRRWRSRYGAVAGLTLLYEQAALTGFVVVSHTGKGVEQQRRRRREPHDCLAQPAEFGSPLSACVEIFVCACDLRAGKHVFCFFLSSFLLGRMVGQACERVCKRSGASLYVCSFTDNTVCYFFFLQQCSDGGRRLYEGRFLHKDWIGLAHRVHPVEELHRRLGSGCPHAHPPRPPTRTTPPKPTPTLVVRSASNPSSQCFRTYGWAARRRRCDRKTNAVMYASYDAAWKTSWAHRPHKKHPARFRPPTRHDTRPLGKKQKKNNSAHPIRHGRFSADVVGVVGGSGGGAGIRCGRRCPRSLAARRGAGRRLVVQDAVEIVRLGTEAAQAAEAVVLQRKEPRRAGSVRNEPRTGRVPGVGRTAKNWQ